MAKTVLKTLQECEDFVRGCTVLGTGGGGDPKRGLGMLSDALKNDQEIGWIDIDDVPDDGWTASVFGMGSIAPQTEETLKEIEHMGVKEADVDFSQSIQELMDFAGVKLSAMVASEIGGSNTPNPIVLGGRLGIPTVDGDYVGRAVPEIAQATPFLAGKTWGPYSGVDKYGNVSFIKQAANPAMLERLGKMLAVSAWSFCMMTGVLLQGKEMKKYVIPGTLTKCLKLGCAIREARESGKDPVQAIVDFSDGWLLFEGVVIEKEWEDRGGYMYGTTHLNGTGAFSGHKMDIWFQNENHIIWKDDKVFVTSPDIVQLVDIKKGEPKTNTSLTEGDHMAVVGMQAVEVYRTGKGLELLGPRHFGFDIDYVPIEKVV